MRPGRAGPMPRFGSLRALSALLALLAAAPVPPAARAAAQDPLRVEDLYAALGREPERLATFTEQRESTLFKAPQKSDGTLRFRAPAWLEKETFHPRHERLRIDGDRVSWEFAVERGMNAYRSIAIDADPRLAALATSLRATLAGDLAGVQRYFTSDIAGTIGDWSVTLQPRDPIVAAAVARIVLAGRDRELLRVEILEAGGDRTVMTITPRHP